MSLPRLLVIANVRGAARERRFAAVLAALGRAGAQVDVVRVESPGDAARHARAAVAGNSGVERLVVAGGDGTMNDAVNGLDGATLPVAFLPLGTANVLAQELALPRHPDALARWILHGRAEPVHLGRANGRLFLLMAGVGIDAEVCERIDRGMKSRFRQGAYVATTIERWLRYRPRRYRLTVDGVAYDAASAVVSNAVHYGGPFVFAPEADFREPLLHVCLFRRSGRMAATRYMIAMVLGLLPRMRDFAIVTGRHVVIEAEPGAPAGDPVQVDGDVLARLPVTIEVAEKRLFLVTAG